jgi:hypothetical protein
VNEPAPGSGQNTISDLDRLELLSILRSIQETGCPPVIPVEAADDEIAWFE